MTEGEADGDGSVGRERAALIAFWLVAVVAAVAIRWWNREQWFFLDEWESLANRSLLSGDDLLRPHNEHWSTVPVVGYRVVWEAVGLRHYWPYQAVTIAFHVLGAAMVRAIARRSGADPWLATAAGLVLLLFGAGRDAVAWGVNGFAIAIALGLAAIVLADRSTGSLRGDAAAGAVCTLSLMSSGTGVPFVVAVALVALIRRGWRSALAVAALPAAAQVLWQVTYGVDQSTRTPTADEVAGFLRNLGGELTATLGGYIAIGIVLVVLAVVGLAGRHPSGGWSPRLGELAPALGALAAAVLSAALIARARAAFTVDPAGRYVYLMAALVLPLVAVGLSRLSGGRTWVVAATTVALCVGIPANARDMRPTGDSRYTLGSPDMVIGFATAPGLEKAPADLRPLGRVGWQVTAGWLRAAADEGKLPAAGPAARAAWPWAELVYAFPAVDDTEELAGCRRVPSDRPVKLQPGDHVLVEGAVANVRRAGGGPRLVASIGPPIDEVGRSPLRDEIRLLVNVPPGPVAVSGDSPARAVKVCPRS